uniref:Uncharacterized protein n=1 Tax=Aegilops tauschii TaxID=37682 RepID=N1QXC3_AEGTA|nr:putative F-box protein At5g42430 [Aegilops tauschii subsp. strangulata]
MAKATRAGATPHHRNLPDEIIVWEILVRLPPKALLRCRAVCRAWCSVTSSYDFLLAHHTCQPALPLLRNYENYRKGLDVCCFDHRPRVAAPDHPQPDTRRLIDQTSFLLDDAFCNDETPFSCLVTSSDGLLIFRAGLNNFSICNPATRQYARIPLPTHLNWWILGMYPHPPTGEYRLLLYSYIPAPGTNAACHVLALGPVQPPRHIGWPDAITHMITELESDPRVLFRGSLHWYPLYYEGKNTMIVVFDTTSESFREMRAPVVTHCADLFEMDNMLSMSAFDYVKTIDIWVLQDYEREVWALKQKIELPIAEIKVQCDKYDGRLDLMVVPGDGELLVLVKFDEWLLLVGMDGKLVATSHHKEVGLSHFNLKQTLVPQTFFSTLEGYVLLRLSSKDC